MKRAIKTSLTIGVATVLIGFAVTQARADRVTSANQVNQAVSAPSMLTADVMRLSFTAARAPVSAASTAFADLGTSVSALASTSFSVQATNLSSSRAPSVQTNGAPVIVGDPALPGATDPAPEPTTMLLLGTGLVGAGAVVRRRLKTKRQNSK
jgi:PEP-CTERM motif